MILCLTCRCLTKLMGRFQKMTSELPKLLGPLVAFFFISGPKKARAQNFGRHQPGISITWRSCGNTWGLWALPWPMPVRDPNGMALGCFFSRESRCQLKIHLNFFSALVCPDIGTIDILLIGSWFLWGSHCAILMIFSWLVPISQGWETVQALLDSGADPRARAQNGGRQRERLEDEIRIPSSTKFGVFKQETLLTQIWRLQHRCSSLLNIYMNIAGLEIDF